MALTLLGPLAGQRLVWPEGCVENVIKYGTNKAEINESKSDTQ
jgi:hypothetical protein